MSATSRRPSSSCRRSCRAREPLAAQLNHFLNLLELGAGSDEVTAERNAILPAHKVVHEATLSATNGKA